MSQNLKKLNAYIRENEFIGVALQGYLEELFRENATQVMLAEDGEVTTRIKGRLTMLAELANNLTGSDDLGISQSDVTET